jgi:flagellar biosynthesis protein FlhF
MLKVRLALGDDALVLSTRSGREGPVPWVEISAAPAEEVAEYQKSLEGPGEERGSRRDPERIGPLVLALVGPGGAGKSLTAVKMALSHHAFGRASVGFMTLDTYRAGAVDELQTFAEIAGIHLEVLYHRREVSPAYRRLRAHDAIIVDTPGRPPGSQGTSSPWVGLLREIQPQEVHLALPAGTRSDVARHLAEEYGVLGVTHVLPTKLDQVPEEKGLAELVEAVRLPARWVTNGQEVPGDIRPAGGRILSALGRTAWSGPEDGAEVVETLRRLRTAG